LFEKWPASTSPGSCRDKSPDIARAVLIDTADAAFALRWETPEQLACDLAKRISAVIGDGPIPRSTT
jgi:hypothetical protein